MGPETADAKDAVDEGLRYLADHLVVMVVWLEEQLDKDLDIEIASADRAFVRQLLPNLMESYGIEGVKFKDRERERAR